MQLGKGKTAAGRELSERVAQIEEMIVRAVPPADPPPAHWLSSDAGSSYCYACARKARAAEMELPEPPVEPAGYSWNWSEKDEAQSDLVRQFEDGIDGGFDTHSDTLEYCETCGIQLSCLLTDYGQSEERDHWLNYPVSAGRKIDGFGPDVSYELTRIFMNMDWEGADREAVLDCIRIGEDALAALSTTY